MKVDEIVALKALFNVFVNDCSRVSKIISRTNRYRNASECYYWRVREDEVAGKGSDAYGDSVECYFPLDYLTKTDEELKDIVNCIIREEKSEKERKRKENEKTIRDTELAELKRLQEKYKNEI